MITLILILTALALMAFTCAMLAFAALALAHIKQPPAPIGVRAALFPQPAAPDRAPRSPHTVTPATPRQAGAVGFLLCALLSSGCGRTSTDVETSVRSMVVTNWTVLKTETTTNDGVRLVYEEGQIVTNHLAARSYKGEQIGGGVFHFENGPSLGVRVRRQVQMVWYMNTLQGAFICNTNWQ